MSYPFTMRRATKADKEAVTSLCRSISPDDWVPGAYDAFMAEEPPEGLYLAEAEDGLVGCYHLEMPAPGEAYFSAMRINPQMQGRGIGSLFCRAQIDQAHTEGATTLYLLSVVENLGAHRTVQKNGFANLGEWVIYEDVEQVPLRGLLGRARPASGEDRRLVDRFLSGREPVPVDEVICSPSSYYVVRTEVQSDWDLAKMAVVDGPDGLLGLMLFEFSPGNLLVRRLEGTPEAAADLLAFAVRERERRGCTAITLSLPARCEGLLQPLGLARESAFRAYVFRRVNGVPQQELVQNN